MEFRPLRHARTERATLSQNTAGLRSWRAAVGPSSGQCDTHITHHTHTCHLSVVDEEGCVTAVSRLCHGCVTAHAPPVRLLHTHHTQKYRIHYITHNTYHKHCNTHRQRCNGGVTVLATSRGIKEIHVLLSTAACHLSVSRRAALCHGCVTAPPVRLHGLPAAAGCTAPGLGSPRAPPPAPLTRLSFCCTPPLSLVGVSTGMERESVSTTTVSPMARRVLSSFCCTPLYL